MSTAIVNPEWSARHRELNHRARAAGAYRRSPWPILARSVLVLSVFAGAHLLLLSGPGAAVRMLCLVALAFVTIQSGLLAHDVDHGQITSHRVLREALGQLFMSFVVGQAHAFWRSHHDGHHNATNDPAADPDMQVQFLAFSEGQARRKTGWRRSVVARQHLLIWPVVLLHGASIRFDTLIFLFKEARQSRIDRWVVALHYVVSVGVPVLLLGWTGVTNYLICTLLTGPYLAGSFLWNHVGAHPDEGEPRHAYMQQRLVGARNLPANPLLTFVFGGLNYHVEHHLLPRVPIANLHVVRRELREICQRDQIPLPEYSYASAFAEIYRRLRSIARIAQAEPLAGLQQARAPRGECLTPRPGRA